MILFFAQRTKVIRKAEFLCQEEILNIMYYIKKLNLPMYTNNPLEDINRDGLPVHCTSYLNTNNLFSILFPPLRQKVLSLIQQVNVHQGWGFDTASSRWNIRVVEFHKMDVGGSLLTPNHYDIGSLITVDIMLEGNISPNTFVRIISSNFRAT